MIENKMVNSKMNKEEMLSEIESRIFRGWRLFDDMVWLISEVKRTIKEEEKKDVC